MKHWTNCFNSPDIEKESFPWHSGQDSFSVRVYNGRSVTVHFSYEQQFRNTSAARHGINIYSFTFRRLIIMGVFSKLYPF